MLALRAAFGSLSSLRYGSQNIFPEVELPLIGMIALRLAPEEPVLKRCDDLVFSGKFAFGSG